MRISEHLLFLRSIYFLADMSSNVRLGAQTLAECSCRPAPFEPWPNVFRLTATGVLTASLPSVPSKELETGRGCFQSLGIIQASQNAIYAFEVPVCSYVLAFHPTPISVLSILISTFSLVSPLTLIVGQYDTALDAFTSYNVH